MPETDRFLRMRSVLERVGFSRSTLYRKMQEGTFPRQVQISDYCRGWRESAINRWMANPACYREADCSTDGSMLADNDRSRSGD
jgi:prophage regulatory protein